MGFGFALAFVFCDYIIQPSFRCMAASTGGGSLRKYHVFRSTIKFEDGCAHGDIIFQDLNN